MKRRTLNFVEGYWVSDEDAIRLVYSFLDASERNLCVDGKTAEDLAHESQIAFARLATREEPREPEALFRAIVQNVVRATFRKRRNRSMRRLTSELDPQDHAANHAADTDFSILIWQIGRKVVSQLTNIEDEIFNRWSAACCLTDSPGQAIRMLAEVLGLSTRAVNKHMYSIRKKLGRTVLHEYARIYDVSVSHINPAALGTLILRLDLKYNFLNCYCIGLHDPY